MEVRVLSPALALVVVLATALAASGARAYDVLGFRWQSTTITYHNDATRFAWSVRQAVAAWNESGARIRFVSAPRGRAQLHILASALPGDLAGVAHVTPYGRHRAPRAAFVRLSRRLDRFEAALVAAHELGHVLGLGHDDRRCALMNSSLDNSFGARQSRCPSPPLGRWACRIVQPDDARGAVRLYGGRARPPGRPFCPKYPVPARVVELSAAPSRAPRGPARVVVRWRNPRSAGLMQVDVLRTLGACPATLADPAATGVVSLDRRLSGARRLPPPGGVVMYVDRALDLDTPREARNGRVCYALFALDEAGRHRGGVTVVVDYPS